MLNAYDLHPSGQDGPNGIIFTRGSQIRAYAIDTKEAFARALGEWLPVWLAAVPGDGESLAAECSRLTPEDAMPWLHSTATALRGRWRVADYVVLDGTQRAELSGDALERARWSVVRSHRSIVEQAALVCRGGWPPGKSAVVGLAYAAACATVAPLVADLLASGATWPEGRSAAEAALRPLRDRVIALGGADYFGIN